MVNPKAGAAMHKAAAVSKDKDPVTVRPMLETEKVFVLDSWTASYAEDSFVRRIFAKKKYAKFMGKFIETLLQDPTTRVLVAIPSDTGDLVLGYAVVSEDELHYVYVKSSIRRAGVAKKLLEGLPIKYITAKTSFLERRLKPKERGWELKPRLTL